jgi:dipeptidyl aminopeptidase/acylaminoacyl peptidase
VLLIQGDDDRNVVFSQTVQLAEDLRARHVHVESIVFPDETHDLLLYGSWVTLGHAAADFFDRQLREEKKLSGAN